MSFSLMHPDYCNFEHIKSTIDLSPFYLLTAFYPASEKLVQHSFLLFVKNAFKKAKVIVFFKRQCFNDPRQLHFLSTSHI